MSGTLREEWEECCAERDREKARADAAEAKLNTPELHDFAKGAVLEAAHQRERWGSDHDGGKTPADWFWLVGYLAGKALHSHAEHNSMKALHHTVTAAAALANWHAAILGKTDMRPGIGSPVEAAPDVASILNGTHLVCGQCTTDIYGEDGVLVPAEVAACKECKPIRDALAVAR